MDTPFDLSVLGAELDAARARRSTGVMVKTPALASVGLEKDRGGIGMRMHGTTTRVEEVACSPERTLPYAPSLAGRPEGDIVAHTHDDRNKASRQPAVGPNQVGDKDRNEERPYPLCLLCLSRPPSAVLLPCCHLNLCHICAPLLIQRHRPICPPSFTEPNPNAVHSQTQSSDRIPSSNISNTSSQQGTTMPSAHDTSERSTTASEMQVEVEVETVPLPTPSPQYTRVPYNVLLLRAVANHPKSRAMAMGGYMPPEQGMCGGEMRGEDLAELSRQGAENSGSGPSGKSGVDNDALMHVEGETGTSPGPGNDKGTGVESEREQQMGMRVSHSADERVSLSSIQSPESGLTGEARCLICRQGVRGWLRVYTG